MQDLARIARWMAGKAVGLVLSGGGSRGLAHLGVLHALDDAGVPVDVIGGTSQASICLLTFLHYLAANWLQNQWGLSCLRQIISMTACLCQQYVGPLCSASYSLGFFSRRLPQRWRKEGPFCRDNPKNYLQAVSILSMS